MREPHLMHIQRWMQIRPSNQRPDESITSSKPTNQREPGRTRADFELIKVISHQCVIIGRYNSTTEFVRRQWHLQHHACKVEWQRTSCLIIDSFTIEATTTSLGRPSQLWPTSLLHPVNSDPSDIIRTLNGILETGLSARIQTVIDIHCYLSNEQLTINRCN